MTDQTKARAKLTAERALIIIASAVASAFASYNGSSRATELTLDSKVDRVEFVREISRLERLISDERTYRGVIIDRLDEMRDELRELNARLPR